MLNLYERVTHRIGASVIIAVTALVSAGAAITASSGHATAVAASVPRAALASAACDLNANAGNLALQVAAARPGETVCLASGNYGTFIGAAKSGMVTIRPAAGARVEMTVVFTGASNLTVTGVTLNNATLQGTTHDVTLSDSTVASSGQIVVYPDQMSATSNIVIDHDTLANQSCTGFSMPGRIDVQDLGANNSKPVGLTISNNTLSGGSADGVRIDAGSGIQILNNTFTQFGDQDSCHADTIQLYGSASHIVIKGNFFHDQQNTASCSLGMWNGGDHNVFEDNVVAGTPTNGCYGAINLYGDDSSIVIHNVFEFGGCLPNGLPYNQCGEVWLNTSSGVHGSGTVIRDNIVTDISTGGGPNATYTESHNLCVSACGSGPGDQGPATGDIIGRPTFVGGAAPTTFAGFALAPGSHGVGKASDGTNIGLELGTGSGGGGSGTSPGGSRASPGAGSPGNELVAVKLSPRRVRQGRPLTFEIRVRARARVTITLWRLVLARTHGGPQRKVLFERVAKLVVIARPGVTKLRIVRVHKLTLKPGRYQATVVAGGKPRRLSFTVE